MFEDFVDKYQRDGFAVIENFLTEEEIEILKDEVHNLIENMPEQSNRTVFSTREGEMVRGHYFLNSSNKISYFFESEAVDADGKLLVEPQLSLNRIGHALCKNEIFYRITFDERVKDVCAKLALDDPVVVQSSYIFKNPNIGGEIVPHQDATFLYTEPQTLLGFWIALDDATIENGCLWFFKASHKNGLNRRLIRNPDPNGKEFVIFTNPPLDYEKDKFTPVPVKKGTCIIIHGQVVHYSQSNKSSKPRNAYTFHIIDQKNSKYSKENWLQVANGSFLNLNKN